MIETPEPLESPPAPFQWTVHLASLQPGRAVAAGAVCAGAMILSLLSLHNLPFSLMVGGGLFGSLADFFLPVHYRLTERGAEARHLWPFATMEWKQVIRRLMSNEGIRLSPLPRPGRLDPYRGMTLRFGNEDPERIIAAVKRFSDSYSPLTKPPSFSEAKPAEVTTE